MAGAVTTCTDEVFKKIIRSLSPVLLAAQEAHKIIIPPLPRYVFDPCCSNTAHCTNMSDESYAEKSISGVTKLRGILKKECKDMGMKKYWILDSIGAILGTPPGTSAGSAAETITDLKPTMAHDGVHLTVVGNRNLSGNIINAITGLLTGTLRGGLSSNVAGGKGTKASKPEYFWRGFVSPVGDLPGRAGPAPPFNHQKRGRFYQGHGHHPYQRRGR
jgi:hypothetical protein